MAIEQQETEFLNFARWACGDRVSKAIFIGDTVRVVGRGCGAQMPSNELLADGLRAIATENGVEVNYKNDSPLTYGETVVAFDVNVSLLKIILDVIANEDFVKVRVVRYETPMGAAHALALFGPEEKIYVSVAETFNKEIVIPDEFGFGMKAKQTPST